MIEELYYTSAPRGLKAGSRDYCTVARTKSLSSELASELQALSIYRILFMPRDPSAALNPVVWSHLRIRFEGEMISVLSRICASGLDYTGRTNKFAHHVALSSGERPVGGGGPAWLLSQPGFMTVAWDGEVGILPGRVPPPGDSTPGIAHAWKEATKDAGWAGVLAETFLADPKRLVYIVFRPGMNLLPLFAEAEALLPPEKRWEVGFNTYYTGLPPGVSCPWLGIVADSPELAEARRLSRSLIIDLTDPVEEARGGALVEQARTGIRPQPQTLPSPAAEPPPPRPRPAPDLRPVTEMERRGREERTQRGLSPGTYDLAATAPPPLPGQAAPPPLKPPASVRRNRRKSMLPLALVTSAISLLLIGAGILVGRMLLPSNPPLDLASTEKSNEPGPDMPRVQQPDLADPSPGRPPEETVPSPESVGPAQPETPEREPEKKQEGKREQPRENPPKKRETAQGPPKPAYRALPKLSTSDPAGPSELLTLDGEGPWTLRLVGLQDAEVKESHLQVDEQSTGGDGTTIQVMYRAQSALEHDAKIARFSIDDRRVRFTWDRELRGGVEASAAEGLRDCVLEIHKAGQVRWTVVLRTLHHKDPLDLDRAGQKDSELHWGDDEAPPKRNLYLSKCKLAAKPGAKQTIAGIPTNSVSKENGYNFPFNFSSESKPIQLSVRLIAIANRPIVVYPEFSPTIAELKKEGNLKANEWKQLKKELEALTQVLPPNEQVRQQIQSQIQQFKPRHDELDAEIKVIDEKIKYIESIKNNYQLFIRIVFKVDGQDFEVFTFGDEEARNP